MILLVLSRTSFPAMFLQTNAGYGLFPSETTSTSNSSSSIPASIVHFSIHNK